MNDNWVYLFFATLVRVSWMLIVLTGTVIYWVFTRRGSFASAFAGFRERWPLGQESPRDPAADLEALIASPVMIYTIRLPQKTEWSSEQAFHFVDQLLFSFPEMVFRIVADDHALVWQIVDFKAIAPNVIEQIIRSSYPAAEVSVEVLTDVEVTTTFCRYTLWYRQANMFVAPILYVTDIKRHDPLTVLTQALTALRPGERVTYTLAVTGYADDAYPEGNRLITKSTLHPLMLLSGTGIGIAAGRKLSGLDRTEKFVARDQKVLDDKLRERLYHAYFLVQVDALSPERLVQVAALVDTQMSHLIRMPYNRLQWIEQAVDQFIVWIATAQGAFRSSDIVRLKKAINRGEKTKADLILEPRELAAIWHLPHDQCIAPRIAWASGMVDAPEAAVSLQEGTLIGQSKYQGTLNPICLAEPDRVLHLNIIGRTGTGKSTLMHMLIHQDIARGAGVTVIDPHGKLVRDILQASIPPEREHDVVVLDLADQDYPPPLNPLSAASSYTGTLRTVGLIERMFVGTDSARMSSYLRATLLPLQTEPQATMRDVARMFTDEVYRERLLNRIDDPETRDFWDYQFNLSSPALQRQIADPIINRVRPFYANPSLYPVLCHPDALDFRALIRQKKILLIALAMDEEQVPEQERNLIGALVMSRLQMSGMNEPVDQPYFVYVDEVQKFVTTSLPEMLSEARKYGLSLVTANQYLGQLTGRTLEAIMGNVGTTVIFRCSPEDAQDLAAYTKPQIDAAQLVDLHRFQAVIKTQVDGQAQPAFSLRTFPPLPHSAEGTEREQRIRWLSRTTYTPKSRSEVLAWLADRYPRPKPTVQVEQPEDEDFYER